MEKPIAELPDTVKNSFFDLKKKTGIIEIIVDKK
jgi:hypothetical protein